MEADHYLELDSSHVTFEPLCKGNSVFFDSANKQVFTVRGQGALGVVVKGRKALLNTSFRIEAKGDVISIKLSPDMMILAVQRSARSVDFFNFKEDILSEHDKYSQQCKILVLLDDSIAVQGKLDLLGFVWASNRDVVYITAKGLELYQVVPDKKTVKHLRNVNQDIKWYFWLSETSHLLVSSGAAANIIHLFHYKGGQLTRLSKFEVDLPTVPRPHKAVLYERDVILANIYGSMYVVVVRHSVRSGDETEIAMYRPKESSAHKAALLKLDTSGRMAVNVVDNLVVVHHPASKSTVMFDIKLDVNKEDGIKCCYPVISPLPIKPFKFFLPSLNINSNTSCAELLCDPCCFWTLLANLPSVAMLISDKTLQQSLISVDGNLVQLRLVRFLLNRADSKQVLLRACRQMLEPSPRCDLSVISQAFDLINQQTKARSEVFTEHCLSPSLSLAYADGGKVLPDQSDFKSHVFSIFDEQKDLTHKFAIAVLVEYLRSLNHYGLPVQYFIHELIVNKLVQTGAFYQLHQLLQYHVLSDSKPLVHLLLSLGGHYLPAIQLALDMLKRMEMTNNEIVEILVSRCQLLPALRFARAKRIVDDLSMQQFLDAAQRSDASPEFYAVFKFFEQRNISRRADPRFQPGDGCDEYIKKFVSMFGSDAQTKSS